MWSILNKKELRTNNLHLVVDINFREYDLDNDPPKIVKYLFTYFQGIEGIRKLREADKFFHEKLEARKRFVAEIDNEIHSTCVLIKEDMGEEEGKFTLYSMVTSSKYQGKGLSKLLVEYIFKWAKEHGGRMILLSTWKENIQARKFYEKMGFGEYGILPKGTFNEEGDYSDQILYFMNLETMNNN